MAARPRHDGNDRDRRPVGGLAGGVDATRSLQPVAGAARPDVAQPPRGSERCRVIARPRPLALSPGAAAERTPNVLEFAHDIPTGVLKRRSARPRSQAAGTAA